MNISDITALIRAFRAETEVGAITPDCVGVLLQKITDAVAELQADINNLIGKDATDAIENFREVIAFLAGCSDDETLQGKLFALSVDIDRLQQEIDSHVSLVSLSAEASSDSVNIIVTGSSASGEHKLSQSLPKATIDNAGIVDAVTFRTFSNAATLVSETAQILKTSAILQFEGFIDSSIDYEPTDADVDKVWYCFADEKFIRWSGAGWTLAPTAYYRPDDSMQISDSAIFRCASVLYRCLDGCTLVKFLSAEELEALGSHINNLANDIASLSASSILPFNSIIIGIPLSGFDGIVYSKTKHRFYRFDDKSKVWTYEFDYNDSARQYDYPAPRLFLCKGTLYSSGSDGLDPILSTSTSVDAIPKATALQSGLLSAEDYSRFNLVSKREPQLNITLQAERMSCVRPSTTQAKWQARLKMRVSIGKLLDGDEIRLFRHGRRLATQKWSNPDIGDSTIYDRYSYFNHGWFPRYRSAESPEDGYENLALTATATRIPVGAHSDNLAESFTLYNLGCTYIERLNGDRIKCSDSNIIDFILSKEMGWYNYPENAPIKVDEVDASSIVLYMRSPSGRKQYRMADCGHRDVTYGVGILRNGVLISNIAKFKLTLGRRELLEFSGDAIADMFRMLSITT